MKDLKDFFHKQGIGDLRWEGVCFPVVPVLPFLKGRPWDEVSLSLVYSLRPSLVRVIHFGGTETCDAIPWRVTVRLDKDELIDEVDQEVQAWSTSRHLNGVQLMVEVLRSRVLSKGVVHEGA